MAHYICTGSCNVVSQNPGECQAENCEMRYMELQECSCENGQHGRED